MGLLQELRFLSDPREEQRISYSLPDLSFMSVCAPCLAVRGCLVNIDAAGCQKDIVKKITSQGAYYLCSQGQSARPL